MAVWLSDWTGPEHFRGLKYKGTHLQGDPGLLCSCMGDRNLESQRIFRFHNSSSFPFGKKSSYFKGLHERQWEWFEVSQSIVLQFWVLYYIIYYILKPNQAKSQSKIKTACSGKLWLCPHEQVVQPRSGSAVRSCWCWGPDICTIHVFRGFASH